MGNVSLEQDPPTFSLCLLTQLLRNPPYTLDEQASRNAIVLRPPSLINFSLQLSSSSPSTQAMSAQTNTYDSLQPPAPKKPRRLPSMASITSLRSRFTRGFSNNTIFQSSIFSPQGGDDDPSPKTTAAFPRSTSCLHLTPSAPSTAPVNGPQQIQTPARHVSGQAATPRQWGNGHVRYEDDMGMGAGHGAGWPLVTVAMTAGDGGRAAPLAYQTPLVKANGLTQAKTAGQNRLPQLSLPRSKTAGVLSSPSVWGGPSRAGRPSLELMINVRQVNPPVAP